MAGKKDKVRFRGEGGRKGKCLGEKAKEARKHTASILFFATTCLALQHRDLRLALI